MQWLRAESRTRVARRILQLVPLVGLSLAASVMNGGTPAAGAAVSLNGAWAPFTRCPVDDPAMLAVDGRATTGFCIAASSPGGSMKLGNTTATTGETNMQFGLTGPQYAPSTVVSPPGGAIVAAPVDVPGGLLGLMCPSADLVVTSVCNLITDNAVNAVTASVQAAGNPSDFKLDALITGAPILTLPIKIQLQNALLGSNCYIGSDADPILLHPAVTDVFNIKASQSYFATDGTPNAKGPLFLLEATGVTEADNSFSVPGASGCGLAGVLDAAINLKVGLPSPSGNNSLVLNDGSSSAARFVGYANAGQQLADAWHSAVCSACPSTPPAQDPTLRLFISIEIPGGLTLPAMR